MTGIVEGNEHLNLPVDKERNRNRPSASRQSENQATSRERSIAHHLSHTAPLVTASKEGKILVRL